MRLEEPRFSYVCQIMVEAFYFMVVQLFVISPVYPPLIICLTSCDHRATTELMRRGDKMAAGHTKSLLFVP